LKRLNIARPVRAFTLLNLFLVLLLQTGCWSTGRVKDSGDHGERSVYRVQSGDTLKIDVFNEPDISHLFKVGHDGAIKHSLLGKVPVAGLTTAQIEKLLYGLLAKDYLVNPIVDVSVAGSTERPVMIAGEVRKPGSYKVEAGGRLTLLQIISQAGGLTDTAACDRVRVVRIIDGKKKTIKVSVDDLFKGRNGITDINLFPGDMITVPETIF